MTGFILKIIAITTMLIDHVGYIFISEQGLNLMFRGIGRLAFPIFIFLVAEGCCKTKDIKKYMARLIAFAFISEIPFDLAFSNQYLEYGHQNVFFTLALGTMSVYLYDLYNDKKFFKYLAIILPPIAAEILHTDYGAVGVLMILAVYLVRDDLKKQLYALVLGNLLLTVISHPIQLLGMLAVVLIYFYNGERGKSIKYFFYIFYPLHLLILGWIQWI